MRGASPRTSELAAVWTLGWEQLRPKGESRSRNANLRMIDKKNPDPSLEGEFRMT